MLNLLGKLLYNVRSGNETLISNEPQVAGIPETITLSSAAFTGGGMVPKRYCGKGVGDNISPPLSWTGAPSDAVEFAIVMEDADTPFKKSFVHLVASGIAGQATSIPEGVLCPENLPAGITIGTDTLGRPGYQGPRALPGHGPHRYTFQIFALNSHLKFDKPPTRKTMTEALHGKVIARGTLVGIFQR